MSTHSQMLQIRRRKQKARKDLAIVAKRAKKLKKQSAKPAGAARPKAVKPEKSAKPAKSATPEKSAKPAKSR